MSQLPFKTWEYEEQTKAKHEAFNDYIDKWIKIVGAYNKLNYIDGFGGIGAYKDRDGKIYYGSPVLVAKTIQSVTSKLQRAIKILIIDKNENNIENIKKIFEYEQINIEPIFINSDFDRTINHILDNIQSIAPTFIFIDPFGFKIKMSTIERIMQIEKSEVFLNFMFTRINQFLSDKKKENTFDDLFGNYDWKKCKDLKGEEREKGLIECYRNQLKKFSKYVYYFKLEFPSKRKTYYYLFHLTNHYLGCAIMKSSFAKFHYGRVEYRGMRDNQLGLFESKDVRINELMDYLKNKYRGYQKSFQQIIEEQIDETEYLESHFRDAIKKMENNNLSVSRIPPKTKTGRARTGIQNQDVIIFK
ncbi:MAG: three-Cys-motif partner protein TcmP [Candidatus Cloacimonetes bacterium]|nr:three-Cys-motif partner protein TcmP [Candidatus Cloacimonadota bacterium]